MGQHRQQLHRTTSPTMDPWNRPRKGDTAMQSRVGTYGERQNAIVQIFLAICGKYKHLYCWPSQKTLLLQLDKFYQIKICRRTLCYDLEKMEAEGFFERIKRITKERIKTGRFTSTLYTLKQKTFKLASRLAKSFNRLLSSCRVQTLAHHKSLRENEILNRVAPNVEILLKSPL